MKSFLCKQIVMNLGKRSLWVLLCVFFCICQFSSIWAATPVPLVLSKNSTFEDAIFTTEKMQAGLGTSMAKGDFNNDGIDDFAMGAIREAAPRTTDEVGMVTVFFGGNTLNSLPDTVKTGKESDGYESARLFDITIDKNWLGVLLASGDLNNDGFDDLVIVAQNQADDDKSSKIYVIFGQHISGDVSLNQSADVILSRDAMHIGAVATGDLNGDGFDDLVISDILSSSTVPMLPGHVPNGGVYVVFGKSEWPNSIDLQYITGEESDVQIGADTIFERDNGDGLLQIAGVAAGDLNGDGVADLVLGSPEEENDQYSIPKSGRAYIIFGGRSFPVGRADIKQNRKDDQGEPVIDAVDVVVYGGEENDRIGGALVVTDYNDSPIAIGDINGDGTGDILIGAPSSMNGNVNSNGRGKVEVLFGRTSWEPTVDLYEGYDIRLALSHDAQAIGIETGYSVGVEDVNGDGQGDMVISSHHAPTPKYNGYLHVIYGGADLLKDYDSLEDQSDFLLTTENPPDRYGDSHLGQTFLVGNFNGEGKPDILAAAPKGVGIDSSTSAGWVVMVFEAASKSSSTHSDIPCFPIDITNNYTLSIPSVTIEGVDQPLGITLVPNETFMEWSLVDYWNAEPQPEYSIPFGSDQTLSIPCVDYGLGKLGFSLILDLFTIQFVLDPNSITPL